MKLVADDTFDRSVIQKLREAGHEVISVAEMEPGISDEVVLSANIHNYLATDKQVTAVLELDGGVLGVRGNLKLMGGATIRGRGAVIVGGDVEMAGREGRRLSPKRFDDVGAERMGRSIDAGRPGSAEGAGDRRFDAVAGDDDVVPIGAVDARDRDLGAADLGTGVVSGGKA